jgi:hypothetical protein
VEQKKGFYKIVMVGMALMLIAAGMVLGLRYLGTPYETTESMEAQDSEQLSLDPNAIVDGVHVRTGLKDGPGLTQVVNNCTTCHSAKLVIQNRMGKEQWNATIRWMQQTQGLWDLGNNHEIIVNYLITQYPPIKKGRRAPLVDIEWYDLK